MPSAYPAALDAFATNLATGATIQAATDNDQADAINKIEAELGVTPKGSFSSLAARQNARLTCRKTADTTNATTTQTAITDLTLPVSTTGIDYWFRFFVCWSSGTAGVAARFAITVPAVTGYVYYWIDTMGTAATAPSTSSTGTSVSMTSHNASASAQATVGNATAGSAPPTAATIYGCKIEGVLSNPSATGAIQVTGAAETTGTITWKRGSWGELYIN